MNKASVLMKQKMSATPVAVQPDVWTNSGAERPRFPFTGKPGINFDLDDPSNPFEYFELFCTPDIVEVIARQTNRYAQESLGNTPNLRGAGIAQSVQRLAMGWTTEGSEFKSQ
jgi:hypothetical protein